MTAQLVFAAHFGGTVGQPAQPSIQLQVANEGQRLNGIAPFRAEFRPDTNQFLVNGLDVERTFIARQEEEGGLASAMGGWLPLILVIGAASLVIVDGYDQDPVTPGTGGGP